ncbi:hypothetical protein N2152v2_009976 [Parachlorella kessleri]
MHPPSSQDGSLPHSGPAADGRAMFPLISLPPAKQQQQQQQQRASLDTLQVLLDSAAAASPSLTSLTTLTTCRTIVTAATAAARASPVQSSRSVDKGPDKGHEATGSPAQPCPLHACLLRHGITDLAAFSAPKHLALSWEVVSSNVEPKLAALVAEGLSPKQMGQLLGQGTNSPLACSYKDTFQPNLQLLQQTAAYVPKRQGPKSHLTAAGMFLAASPRAAASYLSRDPGKVQQLLRWLEGSLGIGLQRLAACSSLCYALALSAGAASAVCLSLQEQQVSAERVAHMLVRQPTVFGLQPRVLSARLEALQSNLDLHTAAALQLALANSRLLTGNMEANLPSLLRFLDGYMGEEGAGRRLVRAQPALVTLTAKIAERSIGSLPARGYSQQQIQRMIFKLATILALNLDSPLQRQKLDWIERVSPWVLDDFLDKPQYLVTKTRRLAARLALLQECKLQPPSTAATVTTTSDGRFINSVNKRLARQGRELPYVSWAEWEEAWLSTEEGREWGFPPHKE